MNTAEYQKKKILYHCAKRGLKETEILLRPFVEEALESLSLIDLEDFDRLLGCPDANILKWFLDPKTVPDCHNTPIFRKLLSFHALQKRAPTE